MFDLEFGFQNIQWQWSAGAEFHYKMAKMRMEFRSQTYFQLLIENNQFSKYFISLEQTIFEQTILLEQTILSHTHELN